MPAVQGELIERLPIQALVPYARNARTHSDAQVAQIAASIREFGWTNPVLIDEAGGIIAGHGRVMAARKLGLSQVPCLRLVGLTDTQKRAYILADNQLAMNAGWDEELLRIEIEELKAADFNIDLLGFDEEMLEELEPEVVPPGDPEALPELPAEPVTRPGDVWIMGKHRLMCGDSTSVDAVDKLMAGQKADIVFTDPPYALFGNSTGISGVADDKMVQPFFKQILFELRARSKANAHVYVCCDWHSAMVIESIARQVELQAKNLIVWDKGSGGVGTMYQSCYELVWFFANTPAQKTTTKTGARTRTVLGIPNIWRFKRVSHTEREHNAAKPVDMVCVPIEASSDRGDVVLDLFGGSGSTLIACDKTQRVGRLMEMEPKYCDVIVKRWQDFTGKQAVLEATGEKFDEVAA